MPRPRVTATVTTSTTTKVNLGTHLRMVADRITEHQALAKVVKDAKGTKAKPGRMKRIETEIADIFRSTKQGKALLNGCEVNDTPLKMVIGERSVFDKVGFMKKHGLTEADFAEFTTKVDNAPYLKIGKSDDD